MSKVSLSEKRLQNLKRQLYGGTRLESEEKVIIQPESRETAYLKKDLLRVLVLSLFAFIFQITLFLGLKSNLIKLPF